MQIQIIRSNHPDYCWELIVDGKLFPIRYMGLAGAQAKAKQLQEAAR